MSTEATTAQPPGATDTNWDALTNALEGTTVTKEPPATTTTTTEPPKTDAPAAGTTTTESPKTEETPKQEPTADELKALAKDLGLAETATKEEIEAAKFAKESATPEFKVEEIADNGIEPEDGSWQAVGKELGFEVKGNTIEDFKNAYEAKLTEARTVGLDTLFSTLKPETSTNLKLIEMGYSEDQIFAPTKEIDGYLALDNTALVRADVELRIQQAGLPKELVDTEMEKIVAAGNMDNFAQILRAQLTQSKQNILQEKQYIIQQFEEKTKQAALVKKQEDHAAFTKALEGISTFMDGKLSPQIKSVLSNKYAKGAYDADFSSPEGRANYVLYKELFTQAAKTMKEAIHSKINGENAKKFSAVPPVTNTTGNNQPITKTDDPFAAIDKMAKEMNLM